MKLADQALEVLVALEILGEFFGLYDSWGVPAHFPADEDLEIAFKEVTTPREQLNFWK